MGSRMATPVIQAAKSSQSGSCWASCLHAPCDTSNPTPVMSLHRTADDSLPHAGNHGDRSAEGGFSLKRPLALNVPETSCGALSLRMYAAVQDEAS